MVRAACVSLIAGPWLAECGNNPIAVCASPRHLPFHVFFFPQLCQWSLNSTALREGRMETINSGIMRGKPAASESLNYPLRVHLVGTPRETAWSCQG